MAVRGVFKSCDMLLIISHEVLVVSASEDVDEKSLKKMVEDINRNYLLPDEYLSDNVYKYNLIYNSLEMIA